MGFCSNLLLKLKRYLFLGVGDSCRYYTRYLKYLGNCHLYLGNCNHILYLCRRELRLRLADRRLQCRIKMGRFGYLLGLDIILCILLRLCMISELRSNMKLSYLKVVMQLGLLLCFEIRNILELTGCWSIKGEIWIDMSLRRSGMCLIVVLGIIVSHLCLNSTIYYLLLYIFPTKI